MASGTVVRCVIFPGASGDRGWIDGQIVLAMVSLNTLPNIIGFACAEDLDHMKVKPELCGTVRQYELRILGAGRK